VIAYYDTGVLVKLWVREALSDEVADFVTRRGRAVPFTALHEIETKNALRLKIFRREMNAATLGDAMTMIDEDRTLRRLFAAAPSWTEVFMRAERLSADVTQKTGCRTLDLLHVAAAMVLGCDEFISLDRRQLKAAKAAGLRVTTIE